MKAKILTCTIYFHSVHLGQPLEAVEMPEGCHFLGLVRAEKLIHAHDNPIIQDGDSLIAIAMNPSISPAGKIYAPAKIDQALQHFFQRRNLVALRELALREVADNFANRNMSLAFQPWYPTPQPGKVFPRYRPTWQSQTGR